MSNVRLFQMSVTENYILQVLNNLNTNKGASPDNIPNIFARSFSLNLAIIFNYLQVQEYFWNASNITLVFKSGNRSNVSNYRPISISNCFSEVFEHLVHSAISMHISPRINANQLDFVKHRTTISNLMSYVEYLAKSMDDCIQVDAISTDFAKAFNKLNIKIPLRKLASSFRICAAILGWFETYLEKRTQCAIFGRSLSDVITPISGVPQAYFRKSKNFGFDFKA